MSTVYLERRDVERNMARFYAVTITPTLFGEWAVGDRQGVVRVTMTGPLVLLSE